MSVPLRASYLDQVYEVTESLTVAAHRNVSIAVWRGTPMISALHRIDRYIGELVAKHARVGAVVLLDSPSFKAPDQETREAHVRLVAKYAPQSAGLALIIDGRSAKHSMFRFVLTTLQLMAPPEARQEICSSVASGAAWIASHNRNLVTEELESAISEARQTERQATLR